MVKIVCSVLCDFSHTKKTVNKMQDKNINSNMLCFTGTHHFVGGGETCIQKTTTQIEEQNTLRWR